MLPAHQYPQHEITEAFAGLCLGPAGRREVLARLHAHARVEYRHTALALGDYARLTGFTAANNAYVAAAVELGSAAVTGAVADAGLAAADVDLIVSTTVTGVAVPSIETRLAAGVGLRADVDRMPLFGLGCAGGVAGLARAHDYLTAYPDRIAVVLAVELCTLTVQHDDPSAANMVASGLFGDGAAAVVLAGNARPVPTGASWLGPWLRASRSSLYPDTGRAMGWDIGSSGFKVVLGVEVPELVHEYLPRDVDEFLRRVGLDSADITSWVSHPGGPKVLEAIESALELPADALSLTWDSLARVGNLSSASILHVLHDTIRTRRPAAGSHGLMLAMGPGFASELALLDW